MVEIIPAIIEKKFSEIERKIKEVEPYANWVQVDVSDGVFTKNTTWNNPEDLKKIKLKPNLEIHLMIENPTDHIKDWINLGVKRVIIHINSKSDYQKIVKSAKILKGKGLQLGIALNPEVSILEIKEMLPLADVVVLLAVDPGFSGQKFQTIVLEKIKNLRKLFPDIIIEIDGGINPETAQQCIEAGADMLVSASFIFNSGDIEKAITKLKETK